MDFSLLYKRLLLLVSNPFRFWSQVKEEAVPSSSVRRSFLLPVLFLIALSSFAGTLLYSYNSLSIVYPLLKGLEYFLIFFVTIELVAFLLSEITGYMLKMNLKAEVYKLCVYSLTPFMLLMVVTNLFSSIFLINILGLYGLVILWIGIDLVIGGNKLFRIRLSAMMSAAIIVFYLGVRWMVSALVEGFYFEIFG